MSYEKTNIPYLITVDKTLLITHACQNQSIEILEFSEESITFTLSILKPFFGIQFDILQKYSIEAVGGFETFKMPNTPSNPIIVIINGLMLSVFSKYKLFTFKPNNLVLQKITNPSSTITINSFKDKELTLAIKPNSNIKTLAKVADFFKSLSTLEIEEIFIS